MDRSAGRRKLLAAIGVLTLIAMRIKGLPVRKQVVACAPSIDKKTIRVLSQDGKLMEIDKGDARATGKKISDVELQEWVRRK
jgi:hypothetical protein